jgi:hypothetical protein
VAKAGLVDLISIVPRVTLLNNAKLVPACA